MHNTLKWVNTKRLLSIHRPMKNSIATPTLNKTGEIPF